jgi:hypothetical protein
MSPFDGAQGDIQGRVIGESYLLCDFRLCEKFFLMVGTVIV